MPFLDKVLLGNPLLPWLKPDVQSSGGILNVSSPYPAHLTNLTSRVKFAINRVHEHRERPTKRDDILSRLYEIHRANPERLSFRDVVGAVGINM